MAKRKIHHPSTGCQSSKRGGGVFFFLFFFSSSHPAPALSHIDDVCTLSLLCVCVFLVLSYSRSVSVCVCVYAIVRITELERVPDHANRSIINRCLTSSIIRTIVEKLSQFVHRHCWLFCYCYYYYYYIFLGRRKSLLLLLLSFLLTWSQYII